MERPRQGLVSDETLSYAGESPAETPETPSRTLVSGLERGTKVRRYIVLDRVGEGGMGVVYAAYDPNLDRRVGLKFIAPRGPGRDGLHEVRLLREAQAMARLSHPNVAVVYEVGSFHGHTFVSMEFVKGADLRAWLSSAPRSRSHIIDVFLAAGRGLAAAHAAGIVHRDFKPENVLVDDHDRPRVTDFGLSRSSRDAAKADAEQAEHDTDGVARPSHLATPLTEEGRVLGTPAYMAPEQHRGIEADTRADQFAYCVALYEALHGVRPFAGEGPAEIAEAIAARRFTTPATEVPGWLRAVIKRGLEPEPGDRWPSMDALLAALARDPRTARRRRLAWTGGIAAAATLAVLGGLLLGGDTPELCQGAPAQAAAVWGPAQRERVRDAFLATRSPIAADVFARVDRALKKRLDTWAAAHADACRATHVRGEQSAALLDLRMQCLGRSRRQISSLVALWGAERAVDLEKAIEAASGAGDVAVCADTEALAMPVPTPRDPEARRRIDAVRAQLDHVVALDRAGEYSEALARAREAVAAARPLGYPPSLAEALRRNGTLEHKVGRAEAGTTLLYAAAQAAAEARDDVLSALISSDLLRLHAQRNEFDKAASVQPFAEAAAARAGNREETLAALLRAQAFLLAVQGRYEESLAVLRRALPLYEDRLGTEHLEALSLRHTMATILQRLGRFDESLQIYKRNLAIQELTLGPDHPTVASTLNNLANLLGDKGDYDSAISSGERSLAIRKKIYPPEHATIAVALHTLGLLFSEQNRGEEAREVYERAEKIRVATLGPDHPDTTMTRGNLALLAYERGDSATARRIMESVIASRRKTLGDDHPRLANSWWTLGLALLFDEDWKASEAAFTRALTIRRKQGGDPPELSEALVGLGRVRIGQRRHAAAVALLEQGRAIDERTRGPESPFRVSILMPLGEAYLGTGRVADALRTLEKGVAIAEKAPGAALELPMMRFHHARALWASGERARARVLARGARDTLTQMPPTPRRDRELALVNKWLHAHPGR